MDDDYPCIIGSACRLPGAVLRPEDLWALFHEGAWKKCSTSPPTSRAFTSFSASAQSDNIGTGGWLPEEGVEQFDPSFFGIPISEAATLRPNARLGLELTYEALQNAGIPPSTLRGKNVSVHVGLGTEDGWDMTRWLTDGLNAFDANWAASSDPSGVPGRISHTFDFRGSCNTASNACASGAIALFEGFNSLRYGGAEVAIVGALATHFSPAPFAWAHSIGVASPSHRSTAFSSEADGYSPSEGAVFFVLKIYGSARAAGDTVQAIIRSVASGHNGSTKTLITPSVAAQVAVTKKALHIAKLQPNDIILLEAHGTGTRVGDALEVEGIRAVFRTRHDAPLLLSSSKTVIGHCHGAAALVGVLKVIGCFVNLQVPPHHVAPLPEFLSGPVIIPTESWPLPSSNLFAQVNSFGFTGTVAGIVLEAPTGASAVYVSDPTLTSKPRRWLFLFSAMSKTSFISQIQKVARWVLDTRHPLRDVATLLGICRDHFLEHRRAFIFSSFDDFAILLDEGLSYEHLMQIEPPASDIPADARINFEFLNTIHSNNVLSAHNPSFTAAALDQLIKDGSYIEAARNLYNQGHSLSFEETYRKSHIDPSIITSFPFYPFDRRRWWRHYANHIPRPLREIKPSGPQPPVPGVHEDPILDQESFEALIETYGARIPVLSNPKATNSSTKQTYLLTGSNGMLGSRLLCRFLQDQDVIIYCIVRGDPPVRIRSAFERFKLDISVFNDALSKGVLHLMQTSDLCGPQLGLSHADYTILLNNVDHIIHLAWPVNFNLPLSAFYPFLACTRMLVELCYAAKKLVKLHFTGSYASTFRFPSTLVPEKELAPKVSDSLSQGYAISKLIAEHSLIRIHKDNPSCFRLSILRVGQICGDTATGSWASDELMPMVIASTPALRALPNLFPPVAWIPSDVCTNALFDVAIARETPDLHIVHLANPSVTPWIEAAAEIGKSVLGKPPTMVTFPEYVSMIKQHSGPLPVRRLLPYFEHLVQSMPERYAVLEVTDSIRFSHSLASCVPITADFLDLIVKSVLDQSMNTPSHTSSKPSSLDPIFVFGPSSNQDSYVRNEVLDCIMALAKSSQIRIENLSGNGAILQQQLRTLASQLSIVEGLAACGIKPSAVLGYCFGEYAAASSSGILSEAAAVELLVRRAAALENHQGAMLNAFCDIGTLRTILARLSSPPSIAIIAGPKHIVLSGSSAQIDGAKAHLQIRHIKTINVDTLIPFHSALMDEAIANFVPPMFTTWQSDHIEYISGITASSLSYRSLKVNYWLRHMREPVNFYGSMQYVQRRFPGHPIIDVGPGTTLSKIIGHYGWTDLHLLSPNDARLSKQAFVKDNTTRQKPHSVPFSVREEIAEAETASLSTTPDLYAIALHLLQELFGYEISPRFLRQSLHVTGLQSLDFIRFSDYYGAKTGIHLSLSAYVSGATLERVIAEANQNRD